MHECLDAAASCLDVNPNAALLVLAPVFHSNVSREAIVQKRRTLEDKVMASLGSVLV